MGVVTGIAGAPLKIVKTVGNRFRIAYHENKIDDQIAPESGVSGFLLDKVEDASNFLTMGAVARVKDGIRTKGYGELSGEEMDQALLTQYSENVVKDAEKKAEKQQKSWDKLQKKMDQVAAKDISVETIKQRAANAASLLGSVTDTVQDLSLG